MASAHRTHAGHDHEHGPTCGHTAIRHDGHTDYLHDGCLHHPHRGHVDEHSLAVNSQNPAECTPGFRNGHDEGHRHGPGCGHEAVPHGEHTCYMVDGQLHLPHGDHCDDHGNVEVVQS
jgi:hypothetical protein